MKSKMLENMEKHTASPSFDEGIADLWSRIETALKQPNKKAPNPLVVQFLKRFLPDNWESTAPNNPFHNLYSIIKENFQNLGVIDEVTHEWKEATPKKIQDFQLQYATMMFLYGLFYGPSSRHEEASPFSAPCDYEVHIPFNQPSEVWTQYVIVRANTQKGQRVPVLGFGFPNQFTTAMEALNPPSLSLDKGLDSSEFTEFINSAKKNQIGYDKEMNGCIGYGISTLGDEPGLRLPCYNIPLQCAYEMVRKDVGKFIEDPDLLYVTARDNNQIKTELTRKPLNFTRLCAALMWPFWEIAQFSDHERLDNLIRAVLESGKTCDFKISETESGVGSQKKALRIRCHRMFADHLRRQKTSNKV